jgi:TolC family type I secretion outer membrane protein
MLFQSTARRLTCRRALAGALIAVGLLELPAGAAEPVSELINDPFGTRAALAERLPDLADPLSSACSAAGTALPTSPLSLAQAVDIALCRNPTTRLVWAAARGQAAALGAAQSAWLPSVSATGGESWNNGNFINPLAQPVSSAQRTTDAAVNLSWTLFDFGGRSGRVNSARSLLDAAAGSATSGSQQVVLAVVQAYYGLLAAQSSLEAARRTEKVTARSMEVARERSRSGVVTLADVLQAETAFDQAVLTRMQAELTLANARGSLAVVLGASADQPISLQADPVPEQVPALSARLTDLMNEAARQRPDLAAARAQRDSAQSDIQVARAAGLPSIALAEGLNFVQIPDLPNQNYNIIGLTLSVPLFSGFNTTYSVRQAEAALESREASLEQARLSVSLDVWNGYYALSSSIDQLKAVAALARNAKDNEDVAIGRYEAGVGTIVDVLTAQTAAANALQQRVAVERSWQVARAQLAYALGRLTSAEPLKDVGARTVRTVPAPAARP